MNMYQRTGVKEITVTPAQVQGAATSFEKLSRQADEAIEVVSQGVSIVTADNVGPAVDSFQEVMSSATGSMARFAQLSATAGAAVTTYGAVSEVIGQGRASMDATAAAYENVYRSIDRRSDLSPMAKLIQRSIVINQAKSALVDLQSGIHEAVVAEFTDLHLPEPAQLDSSVNDGARTERIDAAYSSLGQDAQEDLLQEMADQYGEDHGFDAPEIDFFDPNDESLKKKFGDPLPPAFVSDGQLYISRDEVGDPWAMSVVIHEMGHVRQHHYMKEYDGLSPADKRQIEQGQKPDPFEKYGLSLEEVEAMDETNAPHPRDKSYGARQVETEASEQTTQYWDDMTEEEFRKLLEDSRD